jgi:hypothetical protein
LLRANLTRRIDQLEDTRNTERHHDDRAVSNGVGLERDASFGPFCDLRLESAFSLWRFGGNDLGGGKASLGCRRRRVEKA